MRRNRNKCVILLIGMISFVLLSGFDPDTIHEKLEDADTLIAEKKYPEAYQMLNDILLEITKENPNPQEELSKNIVLPRIYFRMGEIRNKQEKYDDAKLYFHKVIDSQFKSYWEVKALFNVGLIDYNIKNYKDARSNFNSIIVEYSDSEEASQALYYIGLCFELEGIKTEAKKSYEKFMELYPAHPWAEKVKAKLDKK